MRAAVLGLGEAGRLYARDLAAAGWQVSAFDPGDVSTPDGIIRAPSAAAAVQDAEFVLAITGARVAVAVAESVAGRLAPAACYADLNSSGPELKRAIAGALAADDARVADVAVLAPVPRGGAATPLAASGPGAAAVARSLAPLGAAVEVLDAPVGAAAERKLLRSVFMKGLAAVLLESMAAATAAGHGGWLRDQVADELTQAGPWLIDRLLDGSRQHAVRRIEEMHATIEELSALGTPTDMSRAALAWLTRLADAHQADQAEPEPVPEARS